MEKVSFKQMKDGTKEEYEFLTAHEIDHTRHTADRLLTALVELDKSLSGYQITRLGHSVQSATRAWRDGADIDWVVSALLHDIGDIYAWHTADGNLVAILTFGGPFAPDGPSALDDKVKYEIHVNDQTMEFQFGKNGDGDFGIRASGIPGVDCPVVGAVGEMSASKVS